MYPLIEPSQANAMIDDAGLPLEPERARRDIILRVSFRVRMWSDAEESLNTSGFKWVLPDPELAPKVR
jgi:hypothetical protein